MITGPSSGLQGKGRSGLTWWLLSLLLGPFATLPMIVAWPAVQPGEPAPEAMGRAQATIIGIVAILLVFAVIGLLAGNFGS